MEFRYDQFGNVTKTIYADDSYTLVRYDNFQRVTAEMQQVAASVTAVWSDTEQSFIDSSTDQRIPTKLYEYDSQGRLAAVLLPAVPDPNDPQASSLRPQYSYAYNEQGNQTLIRDPLGHETRFTFDAQGRQQTRTLPLGFGTDGILGTSDDFPNTLPLGGSSNSEGRAPFTERMEYDARGRMSLQVSFEGIVTEYIYDDDLSSGFATGRMLEKRFFQDEATYNNGNGTPNEVWSYAYDAFGREIKAIQDDGTNVRIAEGTYDAQGRLVEVSTPEGVIAYGYDDLGRKSSTSVYPAGADTSTATPERITTYGYDALGRLASVDEDLDPSSTSDTPLETDYQYDLLGNMDRTDLPNGVVTDYEYDELNRLDVMTDYAPDGSASPGSRDPDLSDNQKLAEYDYEVRADGKRTSATETF